MNETYKAGLSAGVVVTALIDAIHKAGYAITYRYTPEGMTASLAEREEGSGTE